MKPVDEMEPQELHVAVKEEVLGECAHRLVPSENEERAVCEECDFSRPMVERDREFLDGSPRSLPYSRNVEFAWNLVEKPRNENICIDLLCEQEDSYGYGVGFWVWDREDFHDLRKTWCTGTEIAEVICRSALKAVRLKEGLE